jgi:DNA-directed RNA polymerase specialized sigma24 family protein
MKRDRFIDFFYIAPGQQDIHKRLENWARSCYSGGGSSASPMFRLYRATENWARELSIPADHADATKIAKGVAMLPDKHRHALNWNYLEGGSPSKARQKLGVTLDGLMSLITDARQMLINRQV